MYQRVCRYQTYTHIPGEIFLTNVQRWEAPLYGMTDILVFSTHADDEILFLGGVLTNYGGEQNLNVQIAYMCDFFLTEPVRQHEELDGLWECGIKNYPVKGTFEDLYSLSLEKPNHSMYMMILSHIQQNV